MGLFPWPQYGWLYGVGRRDTPTNIVKTSPEKLYYNYCLDDVSRVFITKKVINGVRLLKRTRWSQ
jgi:hypothetical protein